MRMFKVIDGETFLAADERDLVEKMHSTSRAPSPSDEAWMRDVARRGELMTGREIRSDTPGNFVADLMAAGLLEEISCH